MINFIFFDQILHSTTIKPPSENSTAVSANMDKLKNTEAFKELEEYVNNFTGA